MESEEKSFAAGSCDTLRLHLPLLVTPAPPPSREVKQATAPEGTSAPSTFSDRCWRTSNGQHNPGIFDTREIYSNCRLFQNNTGEFLKDLREMGGEQSRRGEIFEPGTTIVHEGQRGVSMYIVHKGELEMLDSSLTVQNTVQAGETYGENHLLGLESKHKWTLRSKTMCHLFRIPLGVFMKALVQHPNQRRIFEREVVRRHESSELQRERGRKTMLATQDPCSDTAPERPTQLMPSKTLASSRGTSPARSLSPVKSTSTTTIVSPLFALGRIETLCVHAKLAVGGSSITKAEGATPLRDSATSSAAGFLVASALGPAVNQEPPELDPGGLSLASRLKIAPRPSVRASSKNSAGGVEAGNNAHRDVGFPQPVWWKEKRPLRTTVTEDETYVNKVKKSLKHDVKNRFRVPSQNTRNVGSRAGPGDDVIREMPMDLALLPPVASMSAAEKKSVQHHLQFRLEARRKFQRTARQALLGARGTRAFG